MLVHAIFEIICDSGVKCSRFVCHSVHVKFFHSSEPGDEERFFASLRMTGI